MFSRIAVVATIFIVATGLYFVVPWSTTPDSPSTNSPTNGVDTNPSDAAALPAVHQTMQRLSAYSQAKPRILSGQNVGHTATDLFGSHYRTWIRLTRFRGQPAPAVMAFDLGLNEIPQNPSPILKLAKPHVEAGGIVTISMHPANPWTEGPYDDRQHGKFTDLFQPGHPAQRRWQQTLDRVARVLKTLQQNDVTVLWRPLHEPNGYWFWWCGGGHDPAFDADQYRRLWTEMQRYFTDVHQLHNLIWVYSANAQIEANVLPPMDFYPGDAMVDVVGLDFYGADIAQLNVNGCYEEIRKSGKIVALTEFGAKPMDGSLDTKKWSTTMRTRHPHFAYFVFWHSWPKNLVSLADMDDIESLMTDQWVQHLSGE